MSLTKNSAVNVIGAFLTLGVSLLSIPLFLNEIGAERYGILALVWVFLSYFYFFDLGIGRAVTYRIGGLIKAQSQSGFPIGEAQKPDNVLIWTAMAVGAPLGVLGGLCFFFVAGYWMQGQVFGSEILLKETISAIKIPAAIVPILILSSVASGALVAREKFIPLNIIMVATLSLNQVLPLLVALSGRVEMVWLLSGVLAGNCFRLIGTFYLCRRYNGLSLKPSFSLSEFKAMVRYGSQFSVLSAVGPFLASLDKIVLAKTIGSAAVGSYSIIFTLVSKLMVLVEAASQTLFPRLLTLNETDAERLTSNALELLAALFTPAIVVSLFLLSPFTTLWIGEEFANRVIGVGEILLVGVWVNCLARPSYLKLQASGRLAFIVTSYIVQIPIFLIMLHFAIDAMGLIGAAMAWSIRVLLDTLILLMATRMLAVALRSQLLRFSMIICSCSLALLMEWSLYYMFALTVMLMIAVYLSRFQIYSTVTKLIKRSTEDVISKDVGG